MELFTERTKGYMCPSCKMFTETIEEVSHHDGTCANCCEHFVIRVEVVPLNANDEPE